MTILFVGGEDGDFKGFYSDAGAASSYYYAPYSRGAVKVTGAVAQGGMGPAYDFPAPQNDVWLHAACRANVNSGKTPNYFMSFSSPAKTRAIGLKRSYDGGFAVLFCDNGSGVELLGTAFNFTSDEGEYDLHAKITGTAVLVEAFKDGALVKSENFTLAVTYSLISFEFAAMGSQPTWSFALSQIIAATESTINWKVFTTPPTGDGAETGFTGTYAAVDDLALNTADLITSDVAAKRTFTRAAITIPAGNEVKAIAVNAYGRTGLPALDDLTLLVRKGSVNYASGVTILSAGFQLAANIWELDPSTSAKWDIALASGTSLQFGVGVA